MSAEASQAASADPARDPRHVAVVGAGLAGLAAAWTLQRRGYRVSVLEAARRVGGRHATESLDGWHYEPGPQLIPTPSPQLAALARALGARQSLRRFPLQSVLAARRRGLAVVDLQRGLSLRVRPRLSWRATRLPDVLAWLGAALDSAAPESGARLDDRSVADWLRLYLGSPIHDEIFEPLLEGLLGLESTDTSRVVLVPLLDAQGAPEVSLAFGVGLLVERMAAELADLRTHTRVERIAADGRVLRTAEGETLRVEATVLATPGAEVPKLLADLSPAESEFFEGCTTRPGLSLAVTLDGTAGLPMPVLWVPRARGGPLAALIDATAGLPANAAAGTSLLLLTARPRTAEQARERPDDAVAESLLQALAALLPELRGRVRGWRLHRLERPSGCTAVGAYRRLARLRKERADAPERRVLLAGSYLVGPHAEGAVRSGLGAADQLCDLLGHPQPSAL